MLFRMKYTPSLRALSRINNILMLRISTCGTPTPHGTEIIARLFSRSSHLPLKRNKREKSLHCNYAHAVYRLIKPILYDCVNSADFHLSSSNLFSSNTVFQRNITLPVFQMIRFSTSSKSPDSSCKSNIGTDCSQNELKPNSSDAVKEINSQNKTTLINILTNIDDQNSLHHLTTSSNTEITAEEYMNATLEKKLMYTMNCWKIDDAVHLLKSSISDGAVPDSTVLLNMLQQIATLGEVDRLLQLYEEVLKGRAFISNANFYTCLCNAYYISGRVEEGMSLLTKNYKEGQDFGDIDILFTILGTMIIKHYEHHYCLVEEFVQTLLESEPPVLSARALLWKCLVLAEKFEQAEELVGQYEELKKKIPAQVTSIVHTFIHLDFDKEIVFLWLIQLPYLKDGLKAAVLHSLIQQKCDEAAWNEAMDFILLAMDRGVRIHQETMKNFLTKFFDEISEDTLEFWEGLVGES